MKTTDHKITMKPNQKICQKGKEIYIYIMGMALDIVVTFLHTSYRSMCILHIDVCIRYINVTVAKQHSNPNDSNTFWKF